MEDAAMHCSCLRVPTSCSYATAPDSKNHLWETVSDLDEDTIDELKAA